MEMTSENINELANYMRSGKLNDYLGDFQSDLEIAKEFMAKYPEIESMDELKELFDKEQEELRMKEAEKNNSEIETKSEDTDER